MDRILTDNVWAQVAPHARACSRRLAAIAYVSTGTRIRLRKGDILVCDASDAAIKAGETSAAVLARWHKAGVRIYSRRGLHAKVLVMGSKALLGSANLSEASATQLREASLLTSRAVVVSQAKAFVHLAKLEGTEVDEEFLDHVSGLEVTRRRRSGPKRKKKQTSLGSRFWVVRVKELDPDGYANEEEYVEQAVEDIRRLVGDDADDVEPIRSTGDSRFRREVRAGDTVVQLFSSQKGKRIAAYPPSAVLLRQDEQHWTRFYLEPAAELDALSWTDFQRRLARLGIASIKKNSCRELNSRDAALIQSIWEE